MSGISSSKIPRTTTLRRTADGALAKKKLFCEMGSDGLTIDDEGKLRVKVGDDVEATVVKTGDEIRLSYKLQRGGVGSPDDFASMYEVLSRRVRRARLPGEARLTAAGSRDCQVWPSPGSATSPTATTTDTAMHRSPAEP